jgi:hypothetical protein
MPGILARRIATPHCLFHNGYTHENSGPSQELLVPLAAERASLVRALSTVALTERRRTARRFLQGLSTEELRYIASYLGACLLESALQTRPVSSRDQIAGDILQYECCRRGYPVQLACGGDAEHKMILLLEYLSCCQCAAAVRVAAGSA